LGTEVTHAVPELAGRIMQAIIIGLREEPLNLIVTIGQDQDPQAFGAQPANVHIERYIPQTLLLPQCQLVISQGGHNTVLAALYQGVPQVIIPIFADQPENAQCCQRLGVGRVIEPFALTPEGLRAVVHDVLANPAYRIHAQRIREEIEALPGLEYGITLLETLVTKQ
jgi:MGT family glycosyltransferase